MHVVPALHGKSQDALDVVRLEAGRPGRAGTLAQVTEAIVWTKVPGKGMEGESDWKHLEVEELWPWGYLCGTDPGNHH